MQSGGFGLDSLLRWFSSINLAIRLTIGRNAHVCVRERICESLYLRSNRRLKLHQSCGTLFFYSPFDIPLLLITCQVIFGKHQPTSHVARPTVKLRLAWFNSSKKQTVLAWLYGAEQSSWQFTGEFSIWQSFVLAPHALLIQTIQAQAFTCSWWTVITPRSPSCTKMISSHDDSSP